MEPSHLKVRNFFLEKLKAFITIFSESKVGQLNKLISFSNSTYLKFLKCLFGGTNMFFILLKISRTQNCDKLSKIEVLNLPPLDSVSSELMKIILFSEEFTCAGCNINDND